MAGDDGYEDPDAPSHEDPGDDGYEDPDAPSYEDPEDDTYAVPAFATAAAAAADDDDDDDDPSADSSRAGATRSAPCPIARLSQNGSKWLRPLFSPPFFLNSM